MRLSIPALVGWLAFLLHLAGNPHYGFFRDELYFIMCGLRPAFGYVDQPPLTPLLAAGSQLFGSSLFLLRAVAAIFAGLSVTVTALLVRELGGRRYAQIFAALVAFLCPVLMAFGMKVGTDMVGLWSWPLLLLYVIRAVNGATPRNWIYAGLVMGVSFQAKYSIVFLAIALLLGLLLTKNRRLLSSRWCWAGVALAVLMALSNVLWQVHEGLPMLEMLKNGQEGKNVILSPLEFIAAQFLLTNPLLSIVWIFGLIWLGRHQRYRFVAITFGLFMGEMMLLHAKHYYPANIYPVMIAAGAVAFEEMSGRWQKIRAASIIAALIGGLVLVPYVLPILPVPSFLAYDAVIGTILHKRLAKSEHHADGLLPQDWADMHGWPELAEEVQRVLATLSPGERHDAVIVASNYGEAAAIEFFGLGHDLPPVISGHNQYFLWGTHGATGNVLIDVNGDCGQSLHLFRSATLAATFQHPYAMPFENNIKIWICRDILRPLDEIWPQAKLYL